QMDESRAAVSGFLPELSRRAHLYGLSRFGVTSRKTPYSGIANTRLFVTKLHQCRTVFPQQDHTTYILVHCVTIPREPPEWSGPVPPGRASPGKRGRPSPVP